MTELVAVDLGGTHARFAIARVEDGRVAALGEACTLRTADHAGFEDAWREFGRRTARPLPRAAAIGLAGQADGEELRLTNNDWVIRPAALRSGLGLDRVALVNDFGAVAHAVAQLGERDFRHLCGPDLPLQKDGVTSIVGPGTGLGVSQLLRRDEEYRVVETEGGHVGFAPADQVEDRILARLRIRFGRVSVERVVSGPGLAGIYQALAGDAASCAPGRDDTALWEAGLAGEDQVAVAALDLFCRMLGSAAGDIALAHGASAVVIAGGLGLRIADRLAGSGFRERFVAKGRFKARMETMPVKIITHPQPGLFGAAAAFAHRFPA